MADATPALDGTIAARPLNVTLNFDRDNDLDRSWVKVIDADGADVASGALTLVGNDASLQQPLEEDIGAGTYDVEFRSCPVDGECESGSYSFEVRPELSDDYLDLRGKREVTIDMRDLQFAQREVIVSPGTSVVWVNQDAVDHFVNTDTHPAHTYHPAQNSRSIGTSERFAVTFTEPGAYPYHCSAHTDMTATLIVA